MSDLTAKESTDKNELTAEEVIEELVADTTQENHSIEVQLDNMESELQDSPSEEMEEFDVSDLTEKEQQRIIDSRILQVLELSDFEDDDDLYHKSYDLPSNSLIRQTCRETVHKEDSVLPGMKPLIKSRYMNMKEVVDEVLKPDIVVLSELPEGYKMNAFCFVHNTFDFSRVNKYFSMDDAGKWETTNHSSQYHIVYESGDFRVISKHNGVFCYRNPRRTEYTPIEPPPNENNLLIICRMYQKLRTDPYRTRRLTKFTHIPKDFESALKHAENYIVYEYSTRSF